MRDGRHVLICLLKLGKSFQCSDRAIGSDLTGNNASFMSYSSLLIDSKDLKLRLRALKLKKSKGFFSVCVFIRD